MHAGLNHVEDKTLLFTEGRKDPEPGQDCDASVQENVTIFGHVRE